MWILHCGYRAQMFATALLYIALLVRVKWIPGIKKVIHTYLHNSFPFTRYSLFHETVVWCLNAVLSGQNFIWKRRMYPYVNPLSHSRNSQICLISWSRKGLFLHVIISLTLYMSHLQSTLSTVQILSGKKIGEIYPQQMLTGPFFFFFSHFSCFFS